jgi:hypothetical protein
VPAVQVVAAVRHHDADRTLEDPRQQEADHVARGGVGPVGVLDDQQQRLAGGDRLEQGVHGVEQLGPADGGGVVGVGATHGAAPGLELGQRGVGLGDLGHHLGEVGGETAEHLGERHVGQRAVAEVETVARDHPPAGAGGVVAQLGQQPGLAHTRVAAEQHGASRGPAGLANAEQVAQLGDLGVTADQDAAFEGNGQGHVSHDGGFARRGGHRGRLVVGFVGRSLRSGRPVPPGAPAVPDRPPHPGDLLLAVGGLGPVEVGVVHRLLLGGFQAGAA